MIFASYVNNRSFAYLYEENDQSRSRDVEERWSDHRHRTGENIKFPRPKKNPKKYGKKRKNEAKKVIVRSNNRRFFAKFLRRWRGRGRRERARERERKREAWIRVVTGGLPRATSNCVWRSPVVYHRHRQDRSQYFCCRYSHRSQYYRTLFFFLYF